MLRGNRIMTHFSRTRHVRTSHVGIIELIFSPSSLLLNIPISDMAATDITFLPAIGTTSKQELRAWLAFLLSLRSRNQQRFHYMPIIQR